MHLNSWLGILFDERTNPARLRAGKKLADDPTRGQYYWKLGINVFRGRTILGDVEPSFAVGKIERAGAARDRVPRVWFEESRRTGVIVARARPADAELLLNLFVRDAGIVGDAALAGPAELVEDLPRLAKRKAMWPAQRLRDVLNDAPVLPRIARRIDCLVDLDHSTFDLGDRTFIFFMQRTGQDDVSIAGRVIEEEIDRHEEVEFLQHAGDE